MVAEAVTDEEPGASGAQGFLITVKSPLAHHNPAPWLKPADLMLVVEGTDLRSLEFGSTTQADWSAQTAFPTQHDGDHNQIQVIMESVRMGGMILSVGVVWWASRVSGLVGSLLSSMPAWRHLDPLPIVGKDKEDDEQAWEQLEGSGSDADADELAISMVLESSRGRTPETA